MDKNGTTSKEMKNRGIVKGLVFKVQQVCSNYFFILGLAKRCTVETPSTNLVLIMKEFSLNRDILLLQQNIEIFNIINY